MKRTLKIFLILISTLGYSQNNSESDIFRKIIEQEIEKGSIDIYIQCEKSKTTFDQKVFKEETILNVPNNILKEIEINGAKSKNEIWNSEITELHNISHHINENCLTKKDAEGIFKNTKKTQNLIAISKPIFDNNYENCIVSITYWKFAPNLYGNKYFLKKVYGVWTIITKYDYSGN